jgi:hypothetical protein
MTEPRRLNRSGGISQRLLDSASLDKPSRASRRHATNLAATASAFSSTSPAREPLPLRRANPAIMLATWIVVGAAASVTLGLVGAKLLANDPAPRAAAPLLTAPRAATTSPDISAEPPLAGPPSLGARPSLTVKPLNANAIEPWVPSPSAVAPDAVPANGPARPSAASLDEVREIEAARAALSRGDANSAIAQLDDYDSAHPNGQLKPEAMALRIQALSTSGKTTEARTLANEFQRKYPGHPLGQQLQRNLPR